MDSNNLSCLRLSFDLKKTRAGKSPELENYSEHAREGWFSGGTSNTALHVIPGKLSLQDIPLLLLLVFVFLGVYLFSPLGGCSRGRETDSQPHCERRSWVFYGEASNAKCAVRLSVLSLFVAAGGSLLHFRFNPHSGRKAGQPEARDQDRRRKYRVRDWMFLVG